MTTHDDDDLPDSPSPAGEHPLAPSLDALALAAELLQTWSSDLASKLSREGASAQPSAQELGEGRRLAQAVEEAWQDVRDRSVWEG